MRTGTCKTCGEYFDDPQNLYPLDCPSCHQRKNEDAKRRSRNAANRARYHARRDCGLVKTPYGWE